MVHPSSSTLNGFSSASAIRVDRKTDVKVLLIDHFVLRYVDAGLELREDIKRRGGNF